MPTADAGSVYGDNCKLYFSATLGGAGALTEAPVVIEDTIGSERRSAESNCRGDAEVSEHVGKPKHSISGSILMKRGSPGATYLTLKTAYMAGTLLHFALATGTITNIDEHVFRLEGKIKKWEEVRGDNDTVKVSFEIVKSAESTYASNWAVVSA